MAAKRRRNGFLNTAPQGVENPPRITKTHFLLGRMHVHIKAARIHGQKQHIGGMSAVMQDVGIGRLERADEQTIADIAPIDEGMLQKR